LFRGCVADRPAPGLHVGLHFVEAAGELIRRLPQTVLSVERQEGCHGDHGKQHVAELVADPRAVGQGECLVHLCHFLADLVPCLPPGWPVEAHAARLYLKALSPEERGEARGNTIEGGARLTALATLVALDPLPLPKRILG